MTLCVQIKSGFFLSDILNLNSMMKFKCSNVIAASVFGELWKLEPLSEERKNRWRREMDWLLSPTNYMIELVPAKQHGSNGRTLEVHVHLIFFNNLN